MSMELRAMRLAISFGYEPRTWTPEDEKSLAALAEALKTVRRETIEECAKAADAVAQRRYASPTPSIVVEGYGAEAVAVALRMMIIKP